MKKNLLLIIITMFLLFPIKMFALECSDTDKQKLQKLATNISYSLEQNNNGTYRIIFTGLSKELTIFDNSEFTFYYNISNNAFGETVKERAFTGETYSFDVYGYETCVFNSVRQINISIPIENKYYKNPLCEQAREYELCKKWKQVNLTEDEFTKEVQKYLDDRDNNSSIDDNYNNDEFTFSFIEFYRNVYFPSLVVTMILSILLIIFWRKESKKNRL